MSNALTLPGVEPPAEDRVEALCVALSAAIGNRTGHHPNVTARWRHDMRLLVTHGPLGTATNHVPPDTVAHVIDVTFAAETWWADRITNPGFLRKHWPRIATATTNARPRRPSADTAALVGKLRNL